MKNGNGIKTLIAIVGLTLFFTGYAIYPSEAERLQNQREEALSKLNKEIIKNNERYNFLTQELEELEKSMSSIESCERIYKANSGTLIPNLPCNELPITLKESELFYTIKTADNPYITQGEEDHFHQGRGGVLATDVAAGFKTEIYAPDYQGSVKAYTVEVLNDKLLGNYAKLTWSMDNKEYYWIIAHLKTKLETGDIVYTGQRIGEMDMSGVTTGYHSHIELWMESVNISYSMRSAIIEERRDLQDYENVEVSEKEEFSYTVIDGEGNLKPDSEKYKDAGEKYGIDWRMISAIHCAETYDSNAKSCSRHTKNPKSYAGAKGCMQFMPKTWNGWTPSSKGYGVDGDGDGVADINNCMDSIHSAANYLAASYNKAIGNGDSEEASRWFAYRQYNHADWYANRAQNIFNTLEY